MNSDQRHHSGLKLFAVSFVMLFLEIFLIRWISTELRVFAYVSNLVLLACFLGIGLGCYYSKKKANSLITILLLLLICAATRTLPFQGITDMFGGFSDSLIWYDSVRADNLLPALGGTGLTILMFVMILGAFVPLGQILGRLLDEHHNIIAGYSLNVFASLIGIWTFNLFSFASTKPWVWFLFALVILAFFVPRDPARLIVAGSASLAILLLVAGADSRWTIWSPYQRLDVYRTTHRGIHNGYTIMVNKVGYMSMLDLSDTFISRHPDVYDKNARRYSQYELLYHVAEAKDAVLIVGAGAGNDAAGALRGGARAIDAVEIDPGIVRLGRALHPEKPYQNPKVRLVVDDARAFFKKAKRTYDIISFGLLDSHTLASDYNNARLDHYVYTRESIEDAKKLLTRDGVLSVMFEAKRPWIGERIYGLLKESFGEVPYVFEIRSPNRAYGWGGLMFITGNNVEQLRALVEADPGLKQLIAKKSIAYTGQVKQTTDDWPYLYLERAHIPRMHLLISASLLVLAFAAKAVLGRGASRGIDAHFFFLGSAFMLLEFQNVSKAALLFGCTWIANSYVISAILFLILLANLVVHRFRIRRIGYFYAGLFASVAVVYMVPLEVFNVFGYWTKSVVAAAFMNIPVFFAGVIFMRSFEQAPSKDRAFGSNLLGAAAGGLLETVSFITGVKALLVLVFVFYGISFGALRLRTGESV
jgi:spermidine synthase